MAIGLDSYLNKRFMEKAGKAFAQPAPEVRAPMAPATPNQTPTLAPASAPSATPTLPAANTAAPDQATPATSPQSLPAAPGAATTADLTSKYIDSLSKTLGGNDATVQNARNTANTQNSVSRYIAGRTAAQQNQNAGFTPGTSQAQRTTDRYNAGASAEILQRDNQVNQMQRERSDAALGAANQLRQENLGQVETLIGSVSDPIAKAYLRQVQAAGGDVREALQGLYQPGSAGTLKDEYRSKSPAETAYADAEDWIRVTQPNLQPGSPEYIQAVQDRLNTADKLSQGPITEAQRQQEAADRYRNALTRGLNALSEKEYEDLAADLPANGVVPTDKGGIEALVGSGKPFVKAQDGNVYQVTGRNSQLRRNKAGTGTGDRTTGWAEAVDRQGNKVYISNAGEVIAYEPPDASDGNKVSFEDGRFVERYAVSGSRTGRVYDPNTQKWVRA